LRAVEQSQARKAQELREHLRFKIARTPKVLVGAFKFKGDVESALDPAYYEGVFRGYLKYAAARGDCHWPHTAPRAFADPFEVGQ
jgi:hypothetical protein